MKDEGQVKMEAKIRRFNSLYKKAETSRVKREEVKDFVEFIATEMGRLFDLIDHRLSIVEAIVGESVYTDRGPDPEQALMRRIDEKDICCCAQFKELPRLVKQWYCPKHGLVGVGVRNEAELHVDVDVGPDMQKKIEKIADTVAKAACQIPESAQQSIANNIVQAVSSTQGNLDQLKDAMRNVGRLTPENIDKMDAALTEANSLLGIKPMWLWIEERTSAIADAMLERDWSLEPRAIPRQWTIEYAFLDALNKGYVNNPGFPHKLHLLTRRMEEDKTKPETLPHIKLVERPRGVFIQWLERRENELTRFLDECDRKDVHPPGYDPDFASEAVVKRERDFIAKLAGLYREQMIKSAMTTERFFDLCESRLFCSDQKEEGPKVPKSAGQIQPNCRCVIDPTKPKEKDNPLNWDLVRKVCPELMNDSPEMYNLAEFEYRRKMAEKRQPGFKARFFLFKGEKEFLRELLKTFQDRAHDIDTDSLISPAHQHEIVKLIAEKVKRIEELLADADIVSLMPEEEDDDNDSEPITPPGDIVWGEKAEEIDILHNRWLREGRGFHLSVGELRSVNKTVELIEAIEAQGLSNPFYENIKQSAEFVLRKHKDPEGRGSIEIDDVGVPSQPGAPLFEKESSGEKTNGEGE